MGGFSVSKINPKKQTMAWSFKHQCLSSKSRPEWIWDFFKSVYPHRKLKKELHHYLLNWKEVLGPREMMESHQERTPSRASPEDWDRLSRIKESVRTSCTPLSTPAAFIPRQDTWAFLQAPQGRALYWNQEEMWGQWSKQTDFQQHCCVPQAREQCSLEWHREPADMTRLHGRDEQGSVECHSD